MGSLVGGWDARRPHNIPKGFEDYKEPCSPRATSKKPHAAQECPPPPSSGLETASCPPTLMRTSSPPIHGASVYKRYLSRQSSSRGGSTPSSPRQPGSPSAASKFTLHLGDGEDDGVPLGKEKWCSRVDSATLNLRPDVNDQASYRSGSFKLADPCHAMHFSTKPCEAQQAMPATPPAPVEQPAPGGLRPAVTVTRVPQGAAGSV